MGGRVVIQRQMRVLVLDQCRGVWGAQRYLLRLAPLLRGHGIELVLAVPRHLEMYDAWRAAGMEVIALDLPVERSIRAAGRPTVRGLVREVAAGVRTARSIAGVIRDGEFDAVWGNAHWVHAEAALAGRMTATPVVLHLHEESVPGLGRWLRAVAVMFARSAVAVSKTVQEGVPWPASRRVCVIPNGVDTEELSPALPHDAAEVRRIRAGLGIGDADVMALAATRLDPSKRIEDLVAAVRLVDDPHLHLVVAGSTSGYPEYEQRIVAENAESGCERITFCGHRGDMPALFRSCDLVIHAGLIEGMPLGLIEAQSCGKPVVAYDVAGVPEAVVDGKTGLLFEARDVTGLSRGLGRLTRDPGLRAEMGAAARAHVVAHHRLSDQAVRNVHVLRAMCGLPQLEAV